MLINSCFAAIIFYDSMLEIFRKIEKLRRTFLVMRGNMQRLIQKENQERKRRMNNKFYLTSIIIGEIQT